MLGSVADDTLLLLKGTLVYLMQVCLTIPTVWMMTNLFGRLAKHSHISQQVWHCIQYSIC